MTARDLLERGDSALVGAPGAAPSPGPERVAAACRYLRHCAVCHGEAGGGAGPAAGLLAPRPCDFTTGRYKFRSTPTGMLPTVEDMVRTIRAGLRGTSMPAYADLLSAEETARLARYVLGLAPVTARRGESIRLEAAPTDDARDASAVVAEGARLYVDAGCAKCHGPDGRATGWRPEREGPGGPPRPTDLTEPWTLRAGSDAEAVTRRPTPSSSATPRAASWTGAGVSAPPLRPRVASGAPSERRRA